MNTSPIRGLLAAFSLVLAGAAGAAQDAAAPTDTTETASRAADELITVDFREEDVSTIIRNIADMLELNVIIPETLQGRTSIKLRDVQWRQVFEEVLAPYGFTFVERDNIVRVISRADLDREPARTEVVTLAFSRASDIAAIVTPMLSADLGERVQVDALSNSLILTVGQRKSAELRAIIDRLDKNPGDSRQVVIDTMFLEASVNDLRAVGANWSALSGYTIRAGPINQSSNMVSTGSFDPITDFFHLNRSSDATSTRTTTSVFNAAEFNLILSALSTAGDIRLVSNPTVVSLTNQEALIDVTTRFPIILTTSTPGASGPTISETREIEEFGIKLRVTPQIRPGEIVSLAVTPEVSSLQREIRSASGNNYPVVDRRSVTNRVNLRDGYTIALGGLVQTQTSIATTRVPLLGSIPGIGGLFRSKREQEDVRNLIIFITARIIDASGNLEGPATNANFDALVPSTANRRALEGVGIRREEIPGYMGPPAPEPLMSDGSN